MPEAGLNCIVCLSEETKTPWRPAALIRAGRLDKAPQDWGPQMLEEMDPLAGFSSTSSMFTHHALVSLFWFSARECVSWTSGLCVGVKLGPWALPRGGGRRPAPVTHATSGEILHPTPPTPTQKTWLCIHRASLHSQLEVTWLGDTWVGVLRVGTPGGLSVDREGLVGRLGREGRGWHWRKWSKP